MHLPLSCCEKAETEKSLCGLGVGRGEGLQLPWKMSTEWPVPHTRHLNEDQVLTQSENGASGAGAGPLGPSTRGNHCLPHCVPGGLQK